nr:response regulator [Methylobacterium sp. BTF04]
MIAEDEALILMQLELLLEDAGHIVVGGAATAEEAIAMAHRTQPDLVFVDLQLRDGSSGLDIVRALRDTGGPAMVFITANARQFTNEFGGAIGVIAKPFTEAVIEDTLSFLAECVRSPPPAMQTPLGLRLAPDYRAHLESLRA